MHPHLTPKFSVITVTYNAKGTVEDTIQSVIAQTYHHVEYIIVDGASTDGTLDIIRRYRDRISTVVSEPDKGLYDAMNKGIRLATGDYLCFLNAGDSFHEDDTLQQMVHSLNNHYLPTGLTGSAAAEIAAAKSAPLSPAPATSAADLPDVLYGETELVDSKGHFVRMRRLSAPEVLTWRSFKHGMLVCHQAFFAKRTLAEPYDLRYRFSADFDWCIRVMKKAHTLHNTHLTLIDYLDEGMTTRNHKASLMERFRIMGHHYGWVSTVLRHAWFVLRAVLKK
ncbi:MAG: glycosyltransferase family 2 protein [Bacteroides sp.]|nr:glycosyltransferase family 2 protein [Bacteroides sp.]